MKNPLRAGLATALSQYLGLLVGLVAVALTAEWRLLGSAWNQVSDRQGLMSAVTLNGNILVRFLALISAFAIFTNLSASFGTEVLAENGLLLQIVLLSQFTVQGLGMTSQTLIGNFKGQEHPDRILSVLQVALATALPIALAFALGTMLFPEIVFKLLTNHSEVSQAMQHYTVWLLPLLSLTAAAFILESYFIGIKDGSTLRNGAVLSFTMVFLPLVLLAIYQQSEHLLWGALTAYMGILFIFLLYRLITTHKLLLADSAG
jgi:multidrug resistance protein, MATE family